MDEQKEITEAPVVETPVPDDILDSVSEEVEVAGEAVVMPEELMSPEWAEIRRNIDNIKHSASQAVGAENQYMNGDFDAIAKAVQGTDKQNAIKALEAITYSSAFTADQKAAAALEIVNYNKSKSADAPVADTAAGIMRYAVQQGLKEDGSLAGNEAIVQAFRNGDSAKAADIEMSLESTDDLRAFRAAQKKGGVKFAIQDLTNRVSGRSEFFSKATATGFVPGVTEGYTSAIYSDIAEGFPEIQKILDEKGKLGGATYARGTLDYAIMEAVSKMPEKRQMELAEKFIKVTQSRKDWGTLAHVYSDVADNLFRRVARPESGKATVRDIMTADGIGAAALTALDTPAAEWAGEYIVRPGFALLDWIPLAAAAKGVVKGSARRIMSTVSDQTRFLGLSRPKASLDNAMAAAQSDDAARALGYASRDEALARMMPNERAFYESSDIAHNVQEKVLGEAEFRKRVFDEMFSVSSSPTNIADPERLKAGLMREMAGGKIVPHTAYTSIDLQDGLFVVRGMFGETAENGYKSEKQAMDTARKFWGKEADIKPVFRRRVSGQVIHPEDANYKELMKDAKANPAEYDWWARVDTKRKPFSIEQEVIGESGSNFFSRAVSADSWVGRNLFGGLAQVVSNDVLQRSIFAAGNSKFAVEQFNRLNDLSRVGVAERKSLSGILYRQNKDKDGTLLTSAQLREQGITSVEGQAAYFNTKLMLDNVKRYTDTNFAEGLTRDGFKDIVGVGGTRLGFGKLTDAGGLTVNKSYNIRVVEDGAEDVITLTGEQAANMAKNGYELYTSKIKEFVKRTSDDVDLESTHFLVAKSAKDKSVLDITPNGVINYSPGYIPEIRTGRIAVYGVSESGARHIEGFADTISEASVVAKQLATDPKIARKYPGGLKTQIYKGVANDYRAMGTDETFENLNGLVYGVKGQEIKNFSGIDGSATMLDPLEAINHMTSMLATQYTKGRHIEYMENLADEFAKKWDLRLPTSARVRTLEDIVPAKDVIGDQLAARNQLEGFLTHLDAQRIRPDAVDDITSKAWKAIADAAATKQWGILGRYVEKMAIARAQSPVNVLQLLTKVNYFTKIRTNPLKHRFMNVASALINVANPVAMAKGLKQRSAFTAAIDLLDSKTMTTAEVNKAMTRLAKGFGVDEGEFREIVKTAREGGIINAADNNILFRNSLETQAQLVQMQSVQRHSRAGSVVGSLDGFWQAINRTLAELGDVAGEREAMITTFLTQYNVLKAEKGFNIATRAGKERLVGKTMVLSGNMVSEGALAMQRGAFRAMFQFNSYSTKMLWNALAPDFMGGARILSKQDRLGMAVTQLAMFGADGVVGARYAADVLANKWANNPDLSQEEQQRRNMMLTNTGAQRWVQNGFIGMFLNNYLKSYMEMWDETDDGSGRIYQDLDWAGFMAVTGSGNMLLNTITDAFKGFRDAAGLIASVGGPDGWWAAGKGALSTGAQASLGISAKMPANIMDSVMSVSRITGSAYRGEEPAWSVLRAGKRAVSENLVAGSRPFISVLMSEKYGEEIVNGKPRNRSFEAGLYGNIKMHLGLQSITEKEAYRLNEEMRKYRQQTVYGSSGYKAKMKESAKDYVGGLIKDLSYLADSDDEKGVSLRDAVMERHGKQLAIELASMKNVDALEYEEAIVEELKAVGGGDSIEAKVLNDALKLTQQRPASYKDFNYIKNVLGESELVREDADMLGSYLDYINEYIAEQFGDYEE